MLGAIMIYNGLSLYLFIAVLLTVYMVAYVQSRGSRPYVRFLFALGLATAIYMLGYASELMAYNYKTALFWNCFQYIGYPFIAALWLTVTLIYTERFFPMKAWKVIAIFLVPVLTFVFRMTANFNDFYFSYITYRFLEDRLLLVNDFGTWYYLQLAHSIAMIIASFYCYVNYTYQNKARDLKRVIIVLMVNFLVIFGVIVSGYDIFNWHIDFLVLFMPLVVVGVTISILKHDFLEIKSITRNHIFEQSYNGMILVNNMNKVLDYNEQAKAYFEIAGTPIRHDMVLDDFADLPLVEAILKNNTKYCFTEAGVTTCLDVRSEIVNKQEGHGSLIILYDVSEKEALLMKLKEQATMDSLSGVYNRRAFFEASEKAYKKMLIEGMRQFLIMIDLDYFKKINDAYGHQTGDQVIGIIGRLLNDYFSETDIVGRIGGEEFAISLLSNDEQAVISKAEGLLKAISQMELDLLGNHFKITISIGLSSTNNEHISFDDLMANADRALYISKNNGRNRMSLYVNDQSIDRFEYSI